MSASETDAITCRHLSFSPRISPSNAAHLFSGVSVREISDDDGHTRWKWWRIWQWYMIYNWPTISGDLCVRPARPSQLYTHLIVNKATFLRQLCNVEICPTIIHRYPKTRPDYCRISWPFRSGYDIFKSQWKLTALFVTKIGLLSLL